jgi:hypothetical protein
VRTPNLDATVRCPAVATVDELAIGAGDVVLLAVKSQDTELATAV